MMSSHLALPRECHLEQVLHIFAYLKKYHNIELVYDPSDPVGDENDFESRDWASSYFGHVEGKEEFPANIPEPRRHEFIMMAKVDDTIYIKTQLFRLLRYYSPALRYIARSDWATPNITHNMTSSIIQPYGLHSF